jgi:hypothetical protein
MGEMRKHVILAVALIAVGGGLLVKRSLVAPGQQRSSSNSESARHESTLVTQGESTAQNPVTEPVAPLSASANRPASEGTPFPPGLQAIVSAEFPAYRIPEGRDIVGGWTVDQKMGVSSFLCRGDFNGDGLEDVAAVLISEQGWRFAIFEQDNERAYRLTFVARPKNKEELGKDREKELLSNPQQISLRKVPKGENWAP